MLSQLCLGQPSAISLQYAACSGVIASDEPVVKSTVGYYETADVASTRRRLISWHGSPNNAFVRPPDIVCRRTYILPGFLISFFFIRQLISELAERNSTIFGHVVGSKCNLKMHVRNLGYPLPLQIGVQKPPFWTIATQRQL